MSVLVPSPSEKDLHKVIPTIRQLCEGRSNATGEFTVTANAASTTVDAPNCTESSVVLLMAKTASAATELATAYITPANGEFVVTHANSAVVDRDFGFVAIG